MKPTIAIIGRPNVGKSTLFNRLIGKKVAITTRISGTTRDRIYEICSWRGKEFIIIDTAGIEIETKKESLSQNIQFQLNIAINEADIILILVDVITGISPEDEKVIERLRKVKKPFILVVNKVDNPNFISQAYEFYKLGLGDPICISAFHGKGTGELLDEIIEKTKKIKEKSKEIIDKSHINVSIVGRPNVGKSTLLNGLLKKERAVVGKLPGTTRDIISSQVKFNDKNITFFDTAGIRRKGKIGKFALAGGRIEKYSVLRAFRAINEAEISLILLDATELLTKQDLHIFGFAKDAGNSIVVLVNKWDLIEKDSKTMDKYLNILRNKLSFIGWAPVIFISALTQKNIDKIPELILELAKEREKRIPTAKLNQFFKEILSKKEPSLKKRKRPKLFYITQATKKPPTFIIFCSYPELIHFSYKRYIENKLREKFSFSGTPIRIIFREKK